jgi:hypothetical protein
MGVLSFLGEFGCAGADVVPVESHDPSPTERYEGAWQHACPKVQPPLEYRLPGRTGASSGGESAGHPCSRSFPASNACSPQIKPTLAREDRRFHEHEFSAMLGKYSQLYG